MTLLESTKIPMGTAAHSFSLMGTNGETYTLESFSEAKVLVLVFMCNHCPYVQAIWERLNDLQDKFGVNGVQLVGVNPNLANVEYDEETMEKMKEYEEKYQMNFPYLADESQEVAKAYGAECTPDIFVYDSERKLAYHGRIDDDWQHPENVQKEEISDAIEMILGGKKVEEQNPSMGCSIKWV